MLESSRGGTFAGYRAPFPLPEIAAAGRLATAGTLGASYASNIRLSRRPGISSRPARALSHPAAPARAVWSVGESGRLSPWNPLRPMSPKCWL